MLVVLLVLGVPGAGASDPYLLVLDSGPGFVTVEGGGFDGPVWLYQCWDSPQSEDDFWMFCDQTTAIQVLNPNGSSEFLTKEVISSGDVGFPPGTENWIGNHTVDWETAEAHCVVAATNDWQSFTEAEIPFADVYGPLAKATATVTPPSSRTSLTDGHSVTVHNEGHRKYTQAMAYACAGFGYAFPGGL